MTNDAPHSAPTPLSRFLGGWMRHPSPQEPGQVAGDAEATEAAEIVEAVEATEAAESAVSPEAASADGPAVSAEVAGPDEPEGSEETVEEEHVIEVADPRDFADDSGPQYEDEDFDDIVDGEE
ncbi:MAG: RNA degradosome polyphosphate kinase, partial [Actinomyces sp.]